MRFFPLLLLLLLASCSGEPKTKNSTDSVPAPATAFNAEEMRAGLDKFEQLRSGFLVRESYDSLAAMYAADARVCPEDGTFLTGTQAITDYWKKYDGINNLSRSIVAINGTADLLYETGVETCSTRGTQRHDRLFWNYKYIVIWKRNADDSWQIVSEMWNRPER